MDGIDSVIDREDATEEEIRREARRACVEYGELEGFWPGITYGGLTRNNTCICRDIVP